MTRAGELFFLLSTDAAGMTYLRAIPAAQITAIETAENDLQQELAYHQQLDGLGEEHTWAAYDSRSDSPDQPVMLHFAINRPPGAVRGESDLAPLLVWLNRYAVWLEDRARLNRYVPAPPSSAYWRSMPAEQEQVVKGLRWTPEEGLVVMV